MSFIEIESRGKGSEKGGKKIRVRKECSRQEKKKRTSHAQGLKKSSSQLQGNKKRR